MFVGNTKGGTHPPCFHPSTSEMSSLRRHVLQNPDILQQMLEDSTWFARDFAGLEFTLISTFTTKAVLGLKGKIQISTLFSGWVVHGPPFPGFFVDSFICGLRQSPAMQSLLNDHDFMRSLLKMDPRLSKVELGSFDESKNVIFSDFG